MKKIAFYTLGCKVNQVETEQLKEEFIHRGYEIVDFTDEADVYLINTCTVTHLGDRKSRQMIRRARRQNPYALVVVMGCYAQRAPGEIMEIPGNKWFVCVQFHPEYSSTVMKPHPLFVSFVKACIG